MRRALRRAADGATLNVDEAAVLLFAQGDDLRRLRRAASAVRDAALANEGRERTVTFSKKVCIPLTRLCSDRCHDCAFAGTPARPRVAGRSPFLPPDEIVEIASHGADVGCKEALFTLGHRPEDRWPEARRWLESRGYRTTLDYLRACAILVLEETGLLPHLNPGVRSWEELARLKAVAPSMRMMLESTSRRLVEHKGQPRHGSPDKDPDVRLKTLADAGRLSIPFTTGVLVGTGDDKRERAESLMAIRRSHRMFGHVQAVIVQNFSAKLGTALQSAKSADFEEFTATIAVARLLFGPAMRIQAPPNLVSSRECLDLIASGIDDWGGLSPVAPDHVNPGRPWPDLDLLGTLTSQAGYRMVERLTVQPRFIAAGQPWIDPRLTGHVQALSDPTTLLAAGNKQAVGRPWQEPTNDGRSQGRVQLHADIDTVGRINSTRSDVQSVFGDWQSVREQVAAVSSPRRLDRELASALRQAEKDPAGCSDDQYVALATASGRELDAVAHFADELRQHAVGSLVTYVVNRNINFTNVCYTGCRFCAFAQRKGDDDAYTLSTSEVAERAWQAHLLGATEVCMQGGIDPEMPASRYLDLLRAIKQRVPSMHIHAFSPMEIVNGASRSGQSIRDWVLALKSAGLDTVPGTAAEILDDEIRWILTKGKLPTRSWVEVITTAHAVGLRSSSTMMYGHVDHPRHWIGHLNVIRAIQDDTGGFTEFVPLPFVHQNSPLYLSGAARPGPTHRDNRAVHALARIMLYGRIDNIQCSWVKLGDRGAQAMLDGGANDLGGTLMEETISRMAGSQHGSARTVSAIESIAHEIGRPTAQRSTDYRRLSPINSDRDTPPISAPSSSISTPTMLCD
jgi:FO synthase